MSWQKNLQVHRKRKTSYGTVQTALRWCASAGGHGGCRPGSLLDDLVKQMKERHILFDITDLPLDLTAEIQYRTAET